MEIIDPRTITGADWPGLQVLVVFLWLVVIFNVSFAFAMLFGHAILPSLIATGHIPQRLRNLRPVLTLLALVALVASLFVVSNWVLGLLVVYNIYPKRLL